MEYFKSSPDLQKNIGNRIQKERESIPISKRKNLFHKNRGRISQEDLGEFLGVGRPAVSSWETGNNLPRLDTLLRLCDLFECDLDYLLGLSDCKQRIHSDVREQTGLSSKAVQNIFDLMNGHSDMQPGGFASRALNAILESPDIFDILLDIGLFLDMLTVIPDDTQDIKDTVQADFDFMSGNPVTLSQSQFIEFWKMHMQQKIFDFIGSLIKQTKEGV